MKPDNKFGLAGMNAQPSVLVVEDDVHIAHVLGFMLERQGYRVIHMADGRAAVQHVVSQPAPDLVAVLRDLGGQRRPRADERHRAEEDVDQLRQLVQ